MTVFESLTSEAQHRLADTEYNDEKSLIKKTYAHTHLPVGSTQILPHVLRLLGKAEGMVLTD